MYKKLATFDELTNLYNRRVGEEKLEKYINNCEIGNHVTIFYIDINNFKLVNDTLGHVAGDNVLKNTAKKLNEFSDNYGFSSRVGGDEFIVVLNETIEYNDIKKLAILLSKHLATPVIINDNLIKLTSSIGIASYPHDAKNCNDLLFSADAAMYNAKKSGLNFSFYKESFKEKYKNELLTDSELISSLSKEHFDMIYRPLIDNQTQEVNGVEALIKWNNTKKDFFYPSEFISLVEHNYSIKKIARWSLEKICRDIKKWEDLGIDNVFVLINLSSSQVKEFNFLEKTKKIIYSSGLNFDKIKLKINYDYKILDFYTSNENNSILKISNLEKYKSEFGFSYATAELISIFDLSSVKKDNKPENICYTINSLSSEYKLKFLLNNTDNFKFKYPIKEQIKNSQMSNITMKPVDNEGVAKIYFNKKNNI